MGYRRHHAIIVTSWEPNKMEEAHNIACDIFPVVSEITKTTVNHYMSFFIPPDGSKEGWDESEIGNKRRDKFITWLDKQRWGDGSTCLGWVEIQYEDDDGVNKITRNSDEEERVERFTKEKISKEEG